MHWPWARHTQSIQINEVVQSEMLCHQQSLLLQTSYKLMNGRLLLDVSTLFSPSEWWQWKCIFYHFFDIYFVSLHPCVTKLCRLSSQDILFWNKNPLHVTKFHNNENLTKSKEAETYNIDNLSTKVFDLICPVILGTPPKKGLDYKIYKN